MPDPAFSNSQNRVIADLIKRVERLEARLGHRDGLNIVSASAPFTVPAQNPDTPDSGVTIGVINGKVAFQHSDGSLETITQVTPAGPVSPVPVFQSPSSPPQTIQGLWDAYRALRDDCQSGLRANLIETKDAFEAVGLLLSA